LIKILTAMGYKVNIIHGVGGNIAVSHKTLKIVLANREQVILYADNPSGIDASRLERTVFKQRFLNDLLHRSNCLPGTFMPIST